MSKSTTAHEFQIGDRVHVWGTGEPEWDGVSGTVVDASEQACYVVLDSHANDDPFRFENAELKLLAAGTGSPCLEEGIGDSYRELRELFGGSFVEEAKTAEFDPADPEHYLRDLQRHAEVIKLFCSRGARLRRRMSADRPGYELTWIPESENRVVFHLFLQPDEQGWELVVGGTSWRLSAPCMEELAWEVDRALSAIQTGVGSVPSDAGEGVLSRVLHEAMDELDDADIRAWIADFNLTPTALLTSKEIRHLLREAGFDPVYCYQRRQNRGWTVICKPTQEVINRFYGHANPISDYLVHFLEKEIAKRIPDLHEEIVIRVGTRKEKQPDESFTYTSYVDIDPRNLREELITQNGLNQQSDLGRALQEAQIEKDDRDSPDKVSESEEPVSNDEIAPSENISKAEIEQLIKRLTLDFDEVLEAFGYTLSENLKTPFEGLKELMHTAGWSGSAPYRKYLPLPREYRMGNLKINELLLDFCFYINDYVFTLVFASNGRWVMRITTRRLKPDQKNEPEMIRRFVYGIEPVLHRVVWPVNEKVVFLAASRAAAEVDQFIDDLKAAYEPSGRYGISTESLEEMPDVEIASHVRSATDRREKLKSLGYRYDSEKGWYKTWKLPNSFSREWEGEICEFTEVQVQVRLDAVSVGFLDPVRNKFIFVKNTVVPGVRVVDGLNFDISMNWLLDGLEALMERIPSFSQEKELTRWLEDETRQLWDAVISKFFAIRRFSTCTQKPPGPPRNQE